MTDLAAEASMQRPRRMRSAASLLLWGAAAALVLCQGVIWYQPANPVLAVLDQFAIQLTLLAGIAALCALALRRWMHVMLLVALAVTFCWPIFAQRAAAAAITDPARLTVLSVNLWHSASGHERTIEALLASDADVIGLLEVTPAWRKSLGPLLAKYPHRVDCLDTEGDCKSMLLSRLPIANPVSGRLWRMTPIVVGGDLQWNGRTVTIFASHWFRPLRRSAASRWGEHDAERAAYLAAGLPLSRQAGQAGLLAKYLDRQPRDLILMGDFNSVPWSRVQRAFRDKTGLDNQAGWSSSWPSFLPGPLRLPIDHILARGHLAVTKFSTGPETDSDHFPVVAEIGWRD
jgi:endonuclease/exonuclease/phosphatase (EEP) superfamily protein YafD